MGKNSESDWDWRDEARYEEDEFWKEIEVNNKRIQNKSKGGLMQQPINMATGGLMNRPIGSREENKKDEAISPYDVDSPKSTRAGMPSRLLGKDRTRFEHGGFHSVEEVKNYLDNPENKEELNKIKKQMSDENFKNFLLNMSKEKFNKDKPKKKKAKTISVAKGGLMKRLGYAARGPILHPDDIPELEEHDDSGIVPTSQKFAGGESARDNLIDKRINKLEAELEIADTGQQSEIINQIKKLETMKSTNIKTAALGGYMDENDIAEQTPLALSIGGQAALGEKYDRRKDYQAYAEGDEVIAEEEIIDEPLMAPPGMDLAEEDAIAETDIELAAEEEVDDILDTSMLSEAEEQIFEEAVEMFPELESIVPKITATEFTEDELVEGPGTGTSDSIPALLSDGEFVFTAKAVKHLGIDKLRKMMKQAEEAYDAGLVEQEDNATMAAEEDSLLV